MLDKLHAALTTYPAFTTLDLARHAELVSQIQFITYNAGDTIFHEDSAADALYMVHKGEVEIVRIRGALTEQVAFLRTGDFFGELGALGGITRTATARAATAAGVFRIDTATVRELARALPEFDRALGSAYADRAQKNAHYYADRAAEGEKRSLYALERKELTAEDITL